MVTGSGARAPIVSRFTFIVGLLGAVLAASACEEPPAQDPSQGEVTYQNGYAQTTPRSQGAASNAASGQSPPVSYAPTSASASAAPAASTPAGPANPLAPQPATTGAAVPALTTPAPIQTTPVPVGVQALPLPASTTAAPPNATTTKPMAVPGPGAFTCRSDAQCLLGRCNTLYGRCAYPCKNSEIDCKPNNVCTTAGLCMPRAAGGLGM